MGRLSGWRERSDFREEWKEATSFRMAERGWTRDRRQVSKSRMGGNKATRSRTARNYPLRGSGSLLTKLELNSFQLPAVGGLLFGPAQAAVGFGPLFPSQLVLGIQGNGFGELVDGFLNAALAE